MLIPVHVSGPAAGAVIWRLRIASVLVIRAQHCDARAVALCIPGRSAAVIIRSLAVSVSAITVIPCRLMLHQCIIQACPRRSRFVLITAPEEILLPFIALQS